LEQLEYNRGQLDGFSKIFQEEKIRDIEIEALVDEALHTSKIEGEYFKRDSVRSSARKKLDIKFDLKEDTSTHKSDALIDILIDSNINRGSLTIERLHGWHNALFVSGYSTINPINVASFRNYDKMEVVSGAIGRERVHYLALPSDAIEEKIKEFLEWCNSSNENIYIKSALAHLWFVIIHPYEDGNGRVARVIADYILSKHQHSSFKFYSISTAINQDRKGYYEVLDKTTNLFRNRDYDFTLWVEWHLKIVNQAMEIALKKIERVINITKFWDRYRDKKLNK